MVLVGSLDKMQDCSLLDSWVVCWEFGSQAAIVIHFQSKLKVFHRGVINGGRAGQ